MTISQLNRGVQAEPTYAQLNMDAALNNGLVCLIRKTETFFGQYTTRCHDLGLYADKWNAEGCTYYRQRRKTTRKKCLPGRFQFQTSLTRRASLLIIGYLQGRTVKYFSIFLAQTCLK